MVPAPRDRDRVIAELAATTAARNAARRAVETAQHSLTIRLGQQQDAEDAWRDALMAALATHGLPRTEIADIARLSRSRLYQIAAEEESARATS